MLTRLTCRTVREDHGQFIGESNDKACTRMALDSRKVHRMPLSLGSDAFLRTSGGLRCQVTGEQRASGVRVTAHTWTDAEKVSKQLGHSAQRLCRNLTTTA